MTSTVFVDKTTPIVAAWCNDVNNAVYNAIGNGTLAPTTPAQVIANLGLASQAVTSIAGLRALPKGAPFSVAIVTGYYTSGDGGGGIYSYIASDTSSADNGGTIIVATDGGRWYLSYTNVLSVKQFGAKGNGTTDDTAAFLALIAFYNVNASFRGGTIRIPAGQYKLTQTLAFTQYAAAGVHNMFIVGDGPENTVLDWTTAAGGTSGITFTQGAHFGIEGIFIKNAPATGIVLNSGGLGTSNYCTYFHIRNVRIQGSGEDNFTAYNTYQGELANCLSYAAGGNGYTFAGYHNTMKISRCDASSNTGVGWVLNGMIYSDFSCCGGESNTQQGWYMTNMNSVTFNSCGAATNVKDGVVLVTSTASVTGLPSYAVDIHGVVFNGFFTINNSTGGAGSYGNFITAVTANSRAIDFIINGGESWPATTSDIALVLAGTSGQVTCHKNLFNDYNYTAADSITGTVEVKNFTNTGRTALVGLSASTVSVANNTLTNLSIAGSFTSNTLAASISGTTIVIPRGVNTVRVSCCVEFAANTTGIRSIYINKNGSGLIGLPVVSVNAASTGDTYLSSTSTDIATVAGDTYGVAVYQNSGSGLNTVITSTYLCVEATS